MKIQGSLFKIINFRGWQQSIELSMNTSDYKNMCDWTSLTPIKPTLIGIFL